MVEINYALQLRLIFRCLKISNVVDPVVCVAAVKSGLDVGEIKKNLPNEMYIWIDPGDVSFRIGDNGEVKSLMGRREFDGLVNE